MFWLGVVFGDVDYFVYSERRWGNIVRRAANFLFLGELGGESDERDFTSA